MMTERNPAGHNFKEKVASVIEEATRTYYACDPTSPARLDKIIALEDAQRVGSFLRLDEAEIIRASLRGMPLLFRQDYLDTVYDSGILWGPQTQEIAQEFALVSPTLGI